MSIRLPSTLALDRVDQWLETYFEANIPESATIAGADVPLPLQSTPAYQLLARVLAIYGVLCKGSHLPCTEFGQVERLAHRGDRWDFTLLVPATSHLPPVVFERLVRLSLRLIELFSSSVPSDEAVLKLYDQLEEILPQFRRLFSDGRANALVAALAHKLSVPFAHLGAGIMQVGYGNRSQLTLRSACLTDSAIGARACNDKFVTSLLLKQAGLPVPQHELVYSEEEALKAAGVLGWPVVIKPADRERGEGVTVGINDPVALAGAFRLAKGLSSRVLVEQQLPGLCHRIFIAGGRLVFATGRQPKSVQGDGCKTVAELVTEANDKEKTVPPWRRKLKFPLDELAVTCLANAGLTPDAVPDEGQMAPLRPFETTEWGGIAKKETPNIHPDNVDLAVRAARALGLSVAGIDLMTVDISRPWHENRAVINEVNFKPYLSGDLKADTLNAYIFSLVPGGGRIPIHAVAGPADPWAVAHEVREQLLASGVRAHVTGHERSESPAGEVMHLTSQGLFMRCVTLLRLPEVEALVVVVDSDEFLDKGLPFDRLERLHTPGSTEGHIDPKLLQLLSRHL